MPHAGRYRPCVAAGAVPVPALYCVRATLPPHPPPVVLLQAVLAGEVVAPCVAAVVAPMPWQWVLHRTTPYTHTVMGSCRCGPESCNGRYTEGGSLVSLLQKLNARARADVRLPCVGRGRGWRCRGRLLVSKDWHCSEKDWHCSDKDWHCSDRRSVCERQCTLTLGRAQLTTRTDMHA